MGVGDGGKGFKDAGDGEEGGKGMEKVGRAEEESTQDGMGQEKRERCVYRLD